MTTRTGSIPAEYPGATPALCVRNASTAIDFYKRAFGARERLRIDTPDGRVGHAEIVIGDAVIMVFDEYLAPDSCSAQTLGGSPVAVCIYVEDVDSFVERATEAGAKVMRPLANQFYGDRNAKLEDPFGHSWFFATRKEDVSHEEMKRRAGELGKNPSAAPAEADGVHKPSPVHYVPKGLHSIQPYLVVPRVAELIEFLKQAFGAIEIERMIAPSGQVAHAEVRIGDSVVMMGESTGEKEPIPAMLYVYVADVDAVYNRALEAGATPISEPADQIYGDRNAGVKDQSGNSWWIGCHIEDVSADEIGRRAAELAKGQEPSS